MLVEGTSSARMLAVEWIEVMADIMPQNSALAEQRLNTAQNAPGYQGHSQSKSRSPWRAPDVLLGLFGSALGGLLGVDVRVQLGADIEANLLELQSSAAAGTWVASTESLWLQRL